MGRGGGDEMNSGGCMEGCCELLHALVLLCCSSMGIGAGDTNLRVVGAQCGAHRELGWGCSKGPGSTVSPLCPRRALRRTRVNGDNRL